MENVVLVLSTNFLLPADDVPLHSVFCHPIIVYNNARLMCSFNNFCLSAPCGSIHGLIGECSDNHSDCFISYCELAKKAMDDPIINMWLLKYLMRGK